ncbi:MAG: 16S rRNA (uracil(1498)-N(3))-methyltransferase [Planctomycetes bacterium]|nr:16S rRNA (uracil(1498)-N(3))-methyltransferase [Planctomycetota bacterium]
MSTAWFHVPSLEDAGIVWIPKDEAKHALGARRLGAGDAVTLFDGAGHVGRGVVTDQRRHDGALAIDVGNSTRAPRARPAVHLVCAIPKGDRSATLIESCMPFEPASITPLACERSVQRMSPNLAARLERIALESCKQSRQPWACTIAPEVSPEAAVRAAHGRSLILHPGGVPLREAVRGLEAVTVLIGPEGGFSDREVAACEAAGAVRVGLGATMLRIELAASAAMSVIRIG